VPRESNTEALEFTRSLAESGFDMVIFLTGVGTRALAAVAETVYPRERFVELLQQVVVVARGPKPVAALRELGVPVAVAVPEPNTWRELLRALDQHEAIRGLRVAVQEYGIANPELLAGLEEQGAQVTRVPVYQWALPEDTGPLRAAVAGIARGEFDVVLFTTSVQVTHLLQVAAEMNLKEEIRRVLPRMVVASIGPTTTEALREHGLNTDLEPSHPKMGFLVQETAARSRELLNQKR
ncbi:MAG: uroporphyrinogen-III synthase, partial [Acidobacteria bacterium]|nr:uroporphyrinogen-III synthase [Acidobacteriota bacterium]